MGAEVKNERMEGEGLDCELFLYFLSGLCFFADAEGEVGGWEGRRRRRVDIDRGDRQDKL